MNVFERYRRLALAVRLLGHHTRLSIVHAATKVRMETLRRLHRELHGRPARGGPLATGIGAVVKTRTQHAQVSLFAGVYLAHQGPVLHQPIDYSGLIDAYELFLALLPTGISPPLSINLAWAIASDLRGGRATFSWCGRCEVQYLELRAASFALRCPLCALYARA